MTKHATKHQLRRWSVQVRWRDRKCVLCGSRDKLQAHHINSLQYFPELALDLDNGVTLCSSDKRGGNRCHIVLHTVFKPTFRHKCTTDDWERFARIVRWAQHHFFNRKLM